ncbi:four-carbon acid sugar kinase family protein [Acuticoccus sp. MNP-M23]|uniref:four-carbon acid sugar kinase family protein n=1 Tax=Acuticoccus sp. MNP-M23 TaxID=3072793 RepID=UPI0028158738|nr:four-carbon acid sugar kinase family protein [Acuticoccus sp. MNP-M23]WMS40913.1 four-carbon acid sugar kinase family protein [Acuticoccus sp. MNP-M23]
MGRPRLLIVADDLTGALDSAAAFAARGLKTAVARHPGALSALPADAQIVAVSTASREGTVADARRAIDAVAAASLHPQRVFKKVDSRLKGHVAAETDALARAFGMDRALVCPAVPLLGRTVENGAVTGAGVDRPIRVAPAFAACSQTVEVCDATVQADLDQVVARAGDALLVGAAGLSLALAEDMAATPPAAPPFGEPILFAIGSRDPVTMEQIDKLLGTAGEPCAGVSLMRQTSAVAEDVAASGMRFAADVAAAIRATCPATVLACGGETANAILAILGIDILELHGEALPGVPVSSAGPFTLLTKSGGFGGPSLLSDIARKAAAP